MTNYYRLAFDELDNRRENAKNEAEAKKTKLYGEIDGLRETDAELEKTASDVFFISVKAVDVKKSIEELKKRNSELREKRAKLLISHGYPADYTTVKYTCEKCADSGYVGLDMCSCVKALAAKLRLADSDLAYLSETESFDTFSLGYYEPKVRDGMEMNVKILKKFADEFDGKRMKNFMLMGGTGLGKTHLSTAVGVAVIEKGYDVVYKSIQSLILEFESAQFKGESSEILEKYFDSDLLIIDDLGAEMSNQFTVSCLYNIINTRLNMHRSTLISTNLTQSELRAKYDDRITSRLLGEYNHLIFLGTDVRRQKLRKG